MALYQASWRVTFGGTVLLDWGDLLSAEPRMSVTGKASDVEGLRSPWASLIPRGLRAITITFARVRLCASANDAQNFLLSHVSTLPVCTAASGLVIELLAGGVLNMAGAVLLPIQDATTDAERFLATYTLQGWSSVYTPPTGGPATPVLGTPAGEVIDFGGGTAVDLSS